MGKCLSKQGGTKGEKPDNAPYTPSKKTAPPPVAAAAAVDIKGQESASKPIQVANQDAQDTRDDGVSSPGVKSAPVNIPARSTPAQSTEPPRDSKNSKSLVKTSPQKAPSVSPHKPKAEPPAPPPTRLNPQGYVKVPSDNGRNYFEPQPPQPREYHNENSALPVHPKSPKEEKPPAVVPAGRTSFLSTTPESKTESPKVLGKENISPTTKAGPATSFPSVAQNEASSEIKTSVTSRREQTSWTQQSSTRITSSSFTSSSPDGVKESDIKLDLSAPAVVTKTTVVKTQTVAQVNDEEPVVQNREVRTTFEKEEVPVSKATMNGHPEPAVSPEPAISPVRNQHLSFTSPVTATVSPSSVEVKTTPDVVDNKLPNEVPTSPVTPTSPVKTVVGHMNGVAGGEEGHTNDVVPRSPITADIPSPSVQPSSSPARPTSLVTKEDAEDNEKNDASDEDDEPIHLSNMRRAVKQLLYDFTPHNEHIREQHELLPKTRVKALQAIERWLLTDAADKADAPRVLFLTGAVGMGKSCMAAEVCKRHADRLAGCHFFQTKCSNLDHNNLRAVIISLAYNLAGIFPDYISTLPRLDKLKDLLTLGDISELSSALLYQPFSNIEHDPESHMLLVLEAIDECAKNDRDALLEIVSNLNSSGPSWLYILVSARTDNQISAQLEFAKVIEVKKSSEALNDVKKILKDPLGKHMDRISLDGGLTQMAKNSEASFLGAHVLSGRLAQLPEERKFTLNEACNTYPTGITANCKEIFIEMKSHLEEKGLRNGYQNILAALCAAREPLPEEFVNYIVRNNHISPANQALQIISPVLTFDNGCVSFCSRWVEEWLDDEQESGDCSVNTAAGHETMATMCTNWLNGIVSDKTTDVALPLQNYALKHAIYHLVEAPKQHENIANLLCNLKYAQTKLKVEGVSIVHLLSDYRHEHVSSSQGNTRSVSLKDYMKKQGKLLEQIQAYEKFVHDKKYDIRQCPDFLLHVAANYKTIERIQSNARVELGNKPWIEDATHEPENNCLMKTVNGSIRAADLSPDGKSLALVVKDEDYNVKLHVIDTSTGKARFAPVDIKSLNDRMGLLSKFTPDGNNIFVGSLTTLLNAKSGKQVLSGFDVQGIELKEKFSIEACDISPKHFACGLTTFPWGGRSLHLIAFDVRTKKCLKTIEVLRYRFGGNAQFGIKAIGVAHDAALMCACVKQSPKPQLRITIWNITKFHVLNSIDVFTEDITKCLFVGDSTLLLGGGIRSMSAAKSNAPFAHLQSMTWDFKEVTNKVSNVWESNEEYSLFGGTGDNVVACRWYTTSSTPVIEIWNSSHVKRSADMRCKIPGLTDNTGELFSAAGALVFVSHDEMLFYNIADLQRLDMPLDSGVMPNITEVFVDSVSFIPKSEYIIVVGKQDIFYNVYLADVTEDDMPLHPTPLLQQTRSEGKMGDCLGQFKTFRGPTMSTEMCFSSADGNALLFNAGDHIKIFDRIDEVVKDLPTFTALKQGEAVTEYTGVKGFASRKDNLVAVVYGQQPNKVYIFDIKSTQMLRKLEVAVDGSRKSTLIDLAFLQSNGVLVTYAKETENSLAAWNPKTAAKLSSQNMFINYARLSPALDRIAISTRKTKRDGQLILRNSDNKFNKKLSTEGGTWLPGNEESDLAFAEDGTIVVGVCTQGSLCRVWNAANAEILRDLPCLFTCDTDIVGMLTNTHVLFCDDRMIVMDVASGSTVAVLPLDHQMERKFSSRGIRISPKTSNMIGCTLGGHLRHFRCHNFVTIKRKTTLQRIKSVQQ